MLTSTHLPACILHVSCVPCRTHLASYVLGWAGLPCNPQCDSKPCALCYSPRHMQKHLTALAHRVQYETSWSVLQQCESLRIIFLQAPQSSETCLPGFTTYLPLKIPFARHAVCQSVVLCSLARQGPFAHPRACGRG